MPFDPLPERPTTSASDAQLAFVARNNVHVPHRIDRVNATHAIGRYVCARRSLPATPRQEEWLRKHELWKDGMDRGTASDAIGEAIRNERRKLGLT